MPPQDVVRQDGDDPYLVVAADKGTATFSDIANGIAADYGFWLGDAFAERRLGRLRPQEDGHHREGRVGSGQAPLPRDGPRHPERRRSRVVGVGDMSGDVFGNGMLLSQMHASCVAAFDHRHIFLDPDPDVATQLGRAQAPVRPAALDAGRTTTSELISQGRRRLSARDEAIPLSPEMQALTGLDGKTGRRRPN